MQLLLASRVLADDTSNAGGTLGLVIFLVLLVGCILLFRSMSGRIKRLPTSFDVTRTDELETGTAGPATPTTPTRTGNDPEPGPVQ
jgi:hypothetical protein